MTNKHEGTLVVSGNSLLYTSQLLLLGKVEYGGGPIFKVVLECYKRCSEPFLIFIYGIQYKRSTFAYSMSYIFGKL